MTKPGRPTSQNKLKHAAASSGDLGSYFTACTCTPNDQLVPVWGYHVPAVCARAHHVSAGHDVRGVLLGYAVLNYVFAVGPNIMHAQGTLTDRIV